MWVSPQSFDQVWLDEFYAILDQQPAWLTGVVFGPQVREEYRATSARVPKRYLVRFYPDITHTRQAEFPVQDWDPAFATTEAREVIDPRPVAEAAIFRRYADSSSGFVTYSEGCNDDFNKFLWSSLGWNPDAKIENIVHDYSRYFISAELADDFGKGLMGLEQNWKGPLADEWRCGYYAGAFSIHREACDSARQAQLALPAGALPCLLRCLCAQATGYRDRAGKSRIWRRPEECPAYRTGPWRRRLRFSMRTN